MAAAVSDHDASESIMSQSSYFLHMPFWSFLSLVTCSQLVATPRWSLEYFELSAYKQSGKIRVRWREVSFFSLSIFSFHFSFPPFPAFPGLVLQLRQRQTSLKPTSISFHSSWPASPSLPGWSAHPWIACRYHM